MTIKPLIILPDPVLRQEQMPTLARADEAFDEALATSLRTMDANDTLYAELMTRAGEFADAGIRSVTRIGDALAPGVIVHAVYSGHRYAEELDAEPGALRYRRDAPLARQV